MRIWTHFTVLGALALTLGLIGGPAMSAEEEAEKKASVSLNVESEGGKTEGDSSEFKLNRPNHRFFNLHLGLGVAGGIGDDLELDDGQGSLGSIGGQFTIGIDFEVLPPLAVSLLSGYTFFANGDSNSLEEAFVAVGVLGRFFVDKKGAWNDGGNILGDLWVDAHFGYFNADKTNGSRHRGGYMIGLGYEFSVAKDINMGPYFRFQHTPIGDGLDYMLFAGGFQLSLAGQFSPDDYDKDGVPDDNDKCIDKPEDIDSFDDLDGCPELDNDEDGIDDDLDKCPMEPELKNGIDDEDGCPEKDDDMDGVLDAVDRCPTVAEDKDGFEDEDGCPDLDNDADEISDDKDKCPGEAEDKDGFEDEDGCPDLDNDGDGFANQGDKCPNEPENKDGVEDDDGCPDGEALKAAPAPEAPAQ